MVPTCDVRLKTPMCRGYPLRGPRMSPDPNVNSGNGATVMHRFYDHQSHPESDRPVKYHSDIKKGRGFHSTWDYREINEDIISAHPGAGGDGRQRNPNADAGSRHDDVSPRHNRSHDIPLPSCRPCLLVECF